VTSADPNRIHTREDSGLRLDREGRWWHDGVLIEHPRIIEAFNRGLRCTADGRYNLEFGWDWCRVEVEDAAYQVLSLERTEQGFLLELSDRTSERLDAATLRIDRTGALVCRVKGGLGKARFTRSAHFALGSHCEERDGALVLRVDDAVHPIRSEDEPAR
jgi:uncharacterized protein